MPAFLRTHYQQYKRDTSQLSTWLAKTAVALGFPVNSIGIATGLPEEQAGPARTSQQARNAKKNARKKAKAKAAARARTAENGSDGEVDADGKDLGEREARGVGEGDDKANDEPEARSASLELGPGLYRLGVNQYLNLAQYAVAKGSDIPVEVVRILRRCIVLRQRAGDRFTANGNSSNESHRHFVDVLQQVLALFHSCRANEPGLPAAVDDLTSNRFTRLAVDFGDEEAEDLADIYIPGLSSLQTVRVEPEVTYEEAIFSVITFLEDTQIIRDYIEHLWMDYAAGTVDLVTAAVTTNTALELIREPHNDLMRQVAPVFDHDLDKMMLAVLFVICPPLIDSLSLFPNVPRTASDIGAAYDFAMFPLIQIMNGFTKLLADPDVIPTYKAGYYGTYEPPANSHRLHFQDRWKRYQILMAESFTDMYYLLELGNIDRSQPAVLFGSRSSSKQNLFFLDELVKSFADYFQTKKWDLFQIAACQIFLDINLIVGNKAADGLKYLRSTADRIIKTLDSRRNIEGAQHPVNWDLHNERIIQGVHHEATAWRDFDFESLATRIPGLDGSGAKLMLRHPRLCGLLLFRLHIKYQDLGFALCNTWASIIYTAHLNNACRIRTPPGESALPVWRDMDLLIDIHGFDNVFAGPVPTNLDDAQSSCLRVAGYPKPVIDAFDRHGTGVDVSAHLMDARRHRASIRPKSLQDRTQILPIFKRKFITDLTTGLDYNITAIETLLSDMQRHGEDDRQHSGSRGKGHGRKKLRKERKHRSPKFSVVQLLAVLELGLQSETRSIRFDYVSMHLRCLRLLRSVHSVSHDYLDRKLGQPCIANDSELPVIVGWIIHFATMSARAGQLSFGIDRRGNEIFSRLLMGATAEVRKLLSKRDEADRESKIVGLQ